MRKKTEGVCRSCLKTFSGSTIGKHLLSCKAKKEKDLTETGGSKKSETTIYYIKLTGGRLFWLHIEMKSTSTLLTLDRFLRDVWVECCGHLSQFKIAGKRYMAQEAGPGSIWSELEARPVDVQLQKVLKAGDKFDYEYDFGSTTYIQGQVIAERRGILKENVGILARNNMPVLECYECDNKATAVCTNCYESLCDECSSKHGCGEEMLMPVVNSPRMGICGYTGRHDPDDFQVSQEVHGIA